MRRRSYSLLIPRAAESEYMSVQVSGLPCLSRFRLHSRLLWKATASQEVAMMCCLYPNLESPGPARTAYSVQARATGKKQVSAVSMAHFSCPLQLQLQPSAESVVLREAHD